jgi:DNA replication protein DnaC
MRNTYEIAEEIRAIGRPDLELAKALRGGGDALARHRQALAEWDAANPEKAARYAELEAEYAEADRASYARQQAAELERWTEKKLADSGMGERALAASASPRPSEALEATQQWLTSGKTWLVLLGGTGTGKTTAAAWAIREVLRQNETAACRTASRIARMSGFDEGAAELERLSEVSLLVVDDVGAEMQTAWGAGLLSELLDNRHQAFRKTILTSNLGQEPFKQRVGERMVDRIREDGKVVVLGGRSMRRQA